MRVKLHWTRQRLWGVLQPRLIKTNACAMTRYLFMDSLFVRRRNFVHLYILMHVYKKKKKLNVRLCIRLCVFVNFSRFCSLFLSLSLSLSLSIYCEFSKSSLSNRPAYFIIFYIYFTLCVPGNFRF